MKGINTHQHQELMRRIYGLEILYQLHGFEEELSSLREKHQFLREAHREYCHILNKLDEILEDYKVAAHELKKECKGNAILKNGHHKQDPEIQRMLRKIKAI